VNLRQAFIEGDFDLEGCQRVENLYIFDSYFTGSLNCIGAHLQGLIMRGSRVEGIDGDRARIDGSVHLNDGFLAEGEVRLLGAQIGGSLDCKGGNFENAGEDALSCDGAKVGGDIFLRGGFAAEGGVRLLGVEIDGDLSCIGGRFKNADGVALACDRLRVTGNVFLSDDFSVQGEVRLLGVEIDGALTCEGGSFENAGGVALSCDSANIRGGVFLRRGFSANGMITFSGTYAQHLLDDDVARSSARASELILDGFTYARITGGAPTDAKIRIAWLMRQKKSHLTTDFRPQPFEQLAKVLREMGHDADARRVAMEKQRLMIPVRVRQAAWFAKPFVWALWQAHRASSGYGYRPVRLIFVLLALWLAGGWFYQQAAEGGVFGPADGQIRTDPVLVKQCDKNWTTCGAERLPAFRPYFYSLDNLPPVIDLGQRKAWIPLNRPFSLIDGWLQVPGGAVAIVVAMQNMLGYVGALLFGAIVTGLIKKD
jgi:hypothetical protein